MRFVWLAPLIAVFGCAHQEGATAESTQPAVAETTPPAEAAPTESATAPTERATAPSASATAPSASATAPRENASAPTAQAKTKPPQLACAPVKVHFALDSDQLYDSEKPVLDRTAACLHDNDTQKVTIVGNADERGPSAYNMDLGQRRADTVAHYLEARGASPMQVEAVISHGEDSPICRASTLDCWQLNRRTAVRQSCHM